jgi:hypothetical protein
MSTSLPPEPAPHSLDQAVPRFYVLYQASVAFNNLSKRGSLPMTFEHKIKIFGHIYTTLD